MDGGYFALSVAASEAALEIERLLHGEPVYGERTNAFARELDAIVRKADAIARSVLALACVPRLRAFAGPVGGDTLAGYADEMRDLRDALRQIDWSAPIASMERRALIALQMRCMEFFYLMARRASRS